MRSDGHWIQTALQPLRLISKSPCGKTCCAQSGLWPEAPACLPSLQWHSQSALCAAEERERRILGLQQDVDSLKARLWDSGTRIADLEKCA